MAPVVISKFGNWRIGETLEDLAEYAMAEGAEGLGYWDDWMIRTGDTQLLDLA